MRDLKTQRKIFSVAVKKRKKIGLKAYYVAEKIGVSFNQFSNLEHGRRTASSTQLRKLIKLLGIEEQALKIVKEKHERELRKFF